ncbi:hypothetical protein DENSPDRAFT_776137 [Dentipellis sp. KUC8613]|nr:hypothetical protein DENSPDRAFT_776137 [Dentipellis sp. KUC8613]
MPTSAPSGPDSAFSLHEFFDNISSSDDLDDVDNLSIGDLDGSDDISDIEPVVESAPPIQHARTTSLRSQMQGNIAAKLKRVFSCMEDEGLDIVLFLDYLSWGDEDCISDPRLLYERTALLSSNILPIILRRWWHPPGGRAKQGRGLLTEFAVACTAELVEAEIARIAPAMKSSPDPLSVESLTSLDFHALSMHLKSPQGCPILWSILQRAGWSEEQATRNTHKTPDNVIMNILSMLSFTRSHHCNRLPMLWSIYLKSCGLSARAFDALHAVGLLMSHKWTTTAFASIASRAEEAAQSAINGRATFLSHDNLNIPKRVFSMRLENQSHFHSACAGTLWVLPKEIVFPATLNREMQESRIQGSKAPFDFSQLLDTDPMVYGRLRNQGVYRILCFLLDCPAFATYQHRNDPILSPPPPVHLLPCGPEHVIKQFILRTADIDEASYGGNEKVLVEWQRQLKIDSLAEMKKTSTGHLIPIVGDQLTVDCLRGLAKYCHDDINSYERLDWIVTVNGWFHIEMAFASSLHKQHLGTSGGVGLHKAFDVLQCKGLMSTQVKGPFWHHLDEALTHVAEAHFRALWVLLSKTKTIGDLAQKTPAELLLLAEDIYDQYACRHALLKMQLHHEQDEVKYQSILFNSDVLSYLDLRDATRTGNVGCMEDLVPTLLLRFAGGGNSKYMIEMLELVQGLRCEWPESVKDIIRTHCWLVNRTGKRDGFVPTDRAQEQNIKDLKVTYHLFGPGATLAYLTKISPAVPVLREVKKHIKWQLEMLLTRGDRHSSPKKEKDIEKYADIVLSERWFTYEKNRRLKKPGDRAKDFITEGATALYQDKAIERWWKGRSFVRSTREKWLDEV